MPITKVINKKNNEREVLITISKEDPGSTEYRADVRTTFDDDYWEFVSCECSSCDPSRDCVHSAGTIRSLTTYKPASAEFHFKVLLRCKQHNQSPSAITTSVTWYAQNSTVGEIDPDSPMTKHSSCS